MNQVMTVESYLEFDTCFHLEYSPSITSFIAQPEGFIYCFDDRDFPYTPDFQIVENDAVKWIEVKPFVKTRSQDFLKRFKVKQEKAIELGVPLILVTEEQIRANPVLNNLKILHRYSGFQSFTTLHFRLLSLVKKVGKISVSDAAKQLGIEQSLMVKSAFSLVSSGVISVDLVNDELGLHSVIWSGQDG
ncbi:TnsA endonuclease N-terminal domain-containing protein [uncultured Photobacterium sp.]|uniref:TnsA endonuclease N-terminal domain-containing protein n=1 Tax=uncultured Photobacterium sp. TaxID=173973 RepID=UPI00261D9B81|nr:TnsA endonuclease N-terminal domain-containing protein [uncultured Photobacterium sp.]